MDKNAPAAIRAHRQSRNAIAIIWAVTLCFAAMLYIAAQIERTARDWSRVAKEPVSVEHIGGAIYGFTSELGALRLFHCYAWADNPNGKFKADWSENVQSWFFRLELAS